MLIKYFWSFTQNLLINVISFKHYHFSFMYKSNVSENEFGSSIRHCRWGGQFKFLATTGQLSDILIVSELPVNSKGELPKSTIPWISKSLLPWNDCNCSPLFKHLKTLVSSSTPLSQPQISKVFFPFLDVLVLSSGLTMTTEVYKKHTNTEHYLIWIPTSHLINRGLLTDSHC